MSKRSNNLHSQIRINYISFSNSKKAYERKTCEAENNIYFDKVFFNYSYARLLFFQNQSRKKKTTCNNHNLRELIREFLNQIKTWDKLM